MSDDSNGSKKTTTLEGFMATSDGYAGPAKMELRQDGSVVMTPTGSYPEHDGRGEGKSNGPSVGYSRSYAESWDRVFGKKGKVN